MLCLALLGSLAPSVGTWPHYCPHCCPASLPTPLCRPAAVHHQALSWQQLCGCSIAQLPQAGSATQRNFVSSWRRRAGAPLLLGHSVALYSVLHAALPVASFVPPYCGSGSAYASHVAPSLHSVPAAPPPLPSQLFFSACPPPLINAACCKAVKLCIAAMPAQQQLELRCQRTAAIGSTRCVCVAPFMQVLAAPDTCWLVIVATMQWRNSWAFTMI